MSWLLSAEHWAEWTLWVTLVAIAHFAIQAVLALRVVMRRRPTGETLAWIFVIFAIPFVGIAAYLLVGESRLGSRRERRFIKLSPPIRRWLGELKERNTVDWSDLGTDVHSLARMCERTLHVPALAGNKLELLGDWQHVFKRLLADIDRAQSSCHLEFYIWNDGGEVDAIVEALLRARQRGVVCRILVDDLGSRAFIRGKSDERLQQAGCQIIRALPGSLLRAPFVRFDLRLHRKIVVIDGHVAYTGSLNMVDPRFFKRDSGVGQWVDAMVRVEGPAVEALAITFATDWFVESNDDLEKLRATFDATAQPQRGNATVQVLPSGPGLAQGAIEQILISAVYSARSELILTSPYFVPSEALSMALVAAARRGVQVVVVVPAKVDSVLVRYASAGFRRELLEAGVRLANFTAGLLHTKSVTVDGKYSLFGSVNLDPRSFRLNFEILLGVYDQEFTRELRDLQQTYIENSYLYDLHTHRKRAPIRRAAENFARLLGPVL